MAKPAGSTQFSDLARVLFPATGTTQGQVIDYYRGIAPSILPGLAERPVSRKRWPDGVASPPFFNTDLEIGTPDWMPRATILHADGPKFYPLIESVEALTWIAQTATLELHVPQWQLPPSATPSPTHRRPVRTIGRVVRHLDRVVLDLDPIGGAGLAECAKVALVIRERLGELGQRTVPVTSGGNGMHLYVPTDSLMTAVQASRWADELAQQLQEDLPQLLVSKVTRALKAGRVLIDWSQNNPARTTIAPYSLRGRECPMVAAPRSWDELPDPDLRQLGFGQILERVEAGFDPMSDPDQPLPRARRRKRGSTSPARAGRPVAATGEALPFKPLPVVEKVISATKPKAGLVDEIEAMFAGVALAAARQHFDHCYLTVCATYAEAFSRSKTEAELLQWQARAVRLRGFRESLDDGDACALDRAVARLCAEQRSVNVYIAAQVGPVRPLTSPVLTRTAAHLDWALNLRDLLMSKACRLRRNPAGVVVGHPGRKRPWRRIRSPETAGWLCRSVARLAPLFPARPGWTRPMFRCSPRLGRSARW